MNRVIYSLAMMCIISMKMAVAVTPLDDDSQEASHPPLSQPTAQENEESFDDYVYNLLLNSATETTYTVNGRKNLKEDRDYSFTSSLGHYVKAE